MWKIFLPLAVAVILSACGGSDSADPVAEPAPAATEAPTTAPVPTEPPATAVPEPTPTPEPEPTATPEPEPTATSEPEPAPTEEPTEEPAVDAAEEPATEEAAGADDVAEEPATEDPATEDPATEDPATEDPATDEPAEDAPATPIGAGIYAASCAGCHGAEGQGSTQGPAISTIGQFFTTDDSALVTLVTNGGTFMPEFGTKLSAEEIDAVVDYVVATFQ